MVSRIVFVGFVSLLASCSGPYDDKRFVVFNRDDFPLEESLTSMPVSFPDDSVVLSADIVACGDDLVLLDRKGDKPYHIFNIITRTYTGSYGRRGEGPGEVTQPWLLWPNGDHEFYVYDAVGKKMLGFRIDSIDVDERPFVEKRIYETRICSSIHLDDHALYFTDELSDSARLFSQAPNDELVGYGTLLRNNLNVSGQNHAQGNRVRMVGNEKKIVVSYVFAPFFEIFDKKKKFWRSFLGPEKFDPMFKEIDNRGYKKFVLLKNKTRVGFIETRITGKFIYILYSGGFASNMPIDVGREIFVFNLDGAPVRHLKLDRDLCTFTIYRDSLLMGIEVDLRTKIFTYDINKTSGRSRR